jgi:hypothetical protein
MKTFHLRAVFIYRASTVILASVLFFGPAHAQERCKIDDKSLAQNAKYVEQHVMDVGDVPGHQIRIFQLHRTYPDDKANCEGLKRTESTAYMF